MFIALKQTIQGYIFENTFSAKFCLYLQVEEYVELDVTDQNRYAAQCFLKMKESSEPSPAMCMTPMLNYTKTVQQPVYSVRELDLTKRITSPSKETALQKVMCAIALPGSWNMTCVVSFQQKYHVTINEPETRFLPDVYYNAYENLNYHQQEFFSDDVKRPNFQ